jgi:ubiquinone/menaquinone biosynthesis C-methylase UbiE
VIERLLASRRAAFPLTVAAYESLLQEMPFLGRTLESSAGIQDLTFWQDGEARCGEIVHLCAGDRGALRRAVSAWVDFSIEYLQRQARFLQTRRYARSSFDQVRQELYENDERMENYYLPALILSFIFSSNYVGYFRFFKTQFLPRLAGARKVCDVGCGHGIYLVQMLQTAKSAFGCAFDISTASLATTRTLLAYHRIAASRYAVGHADLRGRLPVPDHTQDGLACFEVIEHLDNPAHAVAEMRRVLTPGAPLCLSTAIRMESIDHLYVFEEPAQVRAVLIAAGFEVLQEECFPLTPQETRDSQERQRLIDDPSVSVGYVALAR